MALDRPPGWYVISLRPQGDHAPLRRAARAAGGGVIALSPWRIVARDDDATRAALATAMSCPTVVFTSPHAVRAADALMSLKSLAVGAAVAVGEGTSRALRRIGIADVATPARMDSEGLLALPQLRSPQGTRVGLVTAPDGRALLADTLRARGATLLRADVYARESIPIPKAALGKLQALRSSATLALSSEGALRQVLQSLPDDAVATLRSMPVVAASARLVDVAHALGFDDARQAEGPLPRQLVEAIARRAH